MQLSKLKIYPDISVSSVQFKLWLTTVPARVELVEFKEYVGNVVSAALYVTTNLGLTVVFEFSFDGKAHTNPEFSLLSLRIMLMFLFVEFA